MKFLDRIITFKFIICFGVIILCQDTTAKTGHFWHVTDIHLDINYTVEGDPAQMCWALDRSMKISEGLSEFGDHNCDAPKALVSSAINAMKNIFPDPDFILWTGDDTAHVNDSFFSTDIVVDIIKDLTDVIMEVFPDSLVLPVLGNHDFYPQNQAPVGSSDLQTRVADLWKKWLDPFDAYSDFKTDGRYIAHIPDSNVTFVAFNTLLWYEMNDITANDPEANDPAGQFAWANQVIQSLADSGKKVYLMGHIPPGSFERYFDKRKGFHWFQDRYNKQYIDLINKHWGGISAQFYGHNHMDSFRVFLSDGLPVTPISYLLIAPAVSPMRSTLSETAGANNPGIRLIAYDTETGEVHEVSQYYLDLEKTIKEGEDKWTLEYNLTDILNLSKISAFSLYDATLKMKENPSLFDSYYPVNTVQSENITACSDQCYVTQLCAITEIDYSDFYECNGVGWSHFTSLILFTIFFTIILNFVY